MQLSAAVAPLPLQSIPTTDAAKGSGPQNGRDGASTALFAATAPAPPTSSTSCAAASAPLPAGSSSSFHRLSRLERISAMCGAEGAEGSEVSVGELLVTLAYLSRSLTQDESSRIHDIARGAGSGAGAAISMRAFSRLIRDCLQRERELEADETAQAGAGVRCDTEESHRAFVAFALDCLSSHVRDSADVDAINASVSRQTLADELAAARQSARQAEQTSRQLTDRLDRLQLHCRRLESDNSRLAGAQAAHSSRQSSDSEALQSVQTASAHYQQLVHRMTAAAAQSEAALVAARTEHQSSLALLQFERSAKQSLQHEMAAAAEQISALQAGRSSEMRAALKRKKEEMAAIMDSHRYTRELKAQALRVPGLEQDAAQLRVSVAQLQDDVLEYKRLLNDWQLAGGDGQPVTNRSRPAFSLCDDFDMDAGASSSGAASAAASAAHSRRGSTLTASASTAIAALELKLSSQSAELDAVRVELSSAQHSGERVTVQRDALVLQMQEASGQSEVAGRRWQACEARLTEQAEALQASEEQCSQLHEQVSGLQQSEQGWQERLRQWEEERRRMQEQQAAELEAARQAGVAREQVWQAAAEAAAAKLAKLDSLMELLNDDRTSATRRAEAAHKVEVERLNVRLAELSTEVAEWRRKAEEADALRRSQLTAANDSTEASRLLAQRLAEQRLQLEAQAAQAEAARQQALQRLAEVHSRLDELTAAHQSSLAELSASRSQLSSSAASLSACESKLRRLELLYPACVEEVEALRLRVAELGERVRQLEEDRARLQAQIDSHVCSAAVVQLAQASVSAGLQAASSQQRPQALLLDQTALPSQSTLVPPPPAAVWRDVPLSAFQQTEVRAYGTFLNQRLAGDSDLAHLLPVRCDNGELLAKLGDGLLLAKLLNAAQPALIDERVLNRRQAGSILAWQQIAQNLNCVISAAKSIGVTMRQQAAGAAEHSSQAHFTPLQVADDTQQPTDADEFAASRRAAVSVLVNHAGTGAARASLGSQSHYRSALQAAQSAGLDELDTDDTTASVHGRLRGSTAGADSAASSVEQNSAASGRALDAGSAQAQFSQCTQPALVIDFIHQIVRHSLTRDLDTKANCRLLALTTLPAAVKRRGSLSGNALAPLSSAALSCLPHDALFLRWANYHILSTPVRDAMHQVEPITAAGAQLQSGVAFHHIVDAIATFQQSAPRVQSTDSAAPDAALAKASWHSSAGNRDSLLRLLLERLDSAGVAHFHTAEAMSAEHDRLQMLLLGTLYHYCDALPDRASSVDEHTSVDEDADDGEEATREEQAFRSWINSAGIPGVRVHSLVNDCRDGLLLLRLIDWVERGCVDWKRVELRPSNKFKSVTNCNYAVQLCNDALRFNLVNIAGNDIHDGNKKLVLSVMWQLMRCSALKRLERIRQQSGKKSGNAGNKLTDADILAWANSSVSACPHTAAQQTNSATLRSFRDPSCTTGIFLLNLLHSISDTVVDWTQVHIKPAEAAAVVPNEAPSNAQTKAVDSASAGLSVAERCSNARYAISIARKLGAEVFMLPEDLVEVRPKMLLLFVGSLYCVQLLGGIEL